MRRNIFLKSYQIFCGLLSLSAVSSGVMAQPLDDVSLEYQSQGVVATIRLTGQVQYLRHFPASHGKMLEIFYERVPEPLGNQKLAPEVVGNKNVVQDATNIETWVDNEVRKSPPSGLIPSFTVTTRDQKTQPKLVIEFSREAEYSVEAGKDKRSLLITIRPEKRPVATGPLPFLPAVRALGAVPANPTPEVAALAESNKQAHELMSQGREALNAKKNAEAVDAFNKLLLLPPNDYSQDGQEWIGVARERSDQADKARVEFELYLRLYPEGEGAARVAQRLAGLSGHDADQGIVEVAEKKKATRVIKFGSVSSRYYYGKSTNVTSTQNFNGAPETLTTSMTDQSMLISTIDASERYLSEDYDGRLVFRDVNTRNFLANQPSVNRVSAAYGEFKSRKNDFQVRVGRQSAYGGGVLGRFDGVYGSIGQAQLLRVNAVAGALADYSQGSKPKFVGISVDKDAFTFYGINQTVDGLLDRRAVGTEWRYFQDKRYVFATVDYDVNFKAVNAAQVMGTTPVEGLSLLAGGSMVNFLIDHRRGPTLSLRNALNGAATNSVSMLSQNMSSTDLRTLALQRTSTSNMGQIGLTFPLRPKWQAGADVRVSNITGLQQSGLAPSDPSVTPGVIPIQGFVTAMPSRGTDLSVTGTVTGSGIMKVGDIWSGSLSFNTSKAAKGQSFFVYNHSMLKPNWGLDTSLMLYSQTDQFGGKISRVSPMLRASYQLASQLNLDLDGGFERNTFSGANQTSKTSRYFISGGFRWDF